MSKYMIRCICLALCMGAFTVVSAASASRPNIVVFLTDDQGYQDLSPYGGKELRTPNLQKLADAGLSFDAAYVASPSCAPSRAALLTGMMPARNGAEPNHAKPRPEIKKWPAYFQELGYEVVAFGKVAHYRHTVDYGFDYFAHDTFHDHAGIPAAAAYLRKYAQKPNRKPLCIFVGSNWPHVPWPEKDLGYDPNELPLPAGSVDTPKTRQWRAKYAAAVTKADDDLGVIMQAAAETLGENTLFIYSADHGAQWPFGKWNCYEAGIRTPLILTWPGVVRPGTRTGAIVSWIDFLPTLVEVAGGKPPSDIDGLSFLNVLRGKRKDHRDHIFGTHAGDGRFNIYPMRSLRMGHWKYIRNLHPEFAFTTHIDLPVNLGQRDYFETWEAAGKTNAQAAAIVKRYRERPFEELYDLRADPDEQQNLAGNPAHAKRLRTMRTELDRWMHQQGDTGQIYNAPRFLNDTNSYGANAVMGKQ
jgi:N-sulfoglucosamine sulfohydrolase